MQASHISDSCIRKYSPYLQLYIIILRVFCQPRKLKSMVKSMVIHSRYILTYVKCACRCPRRIKAAGGTGHRTRGSSPRTQHRQPEQTAAKPERRTRKQGRHRESGHEHHRPGRPDPRSQKPKPGKIGARPEILPIAALGQAYTRRTREPQTSRPGQQKMISYYFSFLFGLMIEAAALTADCCLPIRQRNTRAAAEAAAFFRLPKKSHDPCM